MYKITYIIPVYNTKPILIERCLNSIGLNNNNLKIIIVDDASNSEETVKYLDKLDKTNNITLLRNKINLGAGESRTIGIKYMLNNFDSDFFTFVDSDDYIHSDNQMRMIEQMIKYNTCIGIGRIKCKPANSTILLPSRRFDEQVINLDDTPEALRIGPSLITNKIYSVRLAPLFIYHPKTRVYEDTEIGYYVLAKNKKIFISKDITYYYEMSSNGLFLSNMNSYNSNGIRQTILSSDSRNQKFIDDGIYEPFKTTLNSIRYAFLMQRICKILGTKAIENKKELISIVLSLLLTDIPNIEEEKKQYGFKYMELNDILFVIRAEAYLASHNLEIDRISSKEELYARYDKVLRLK